ncbi:MAG: chemotaxis protein CheD [Novosphingobium sp.]
MTAFDDPVGTVRVPVLQGEARVSADERVVFGTVLGSCVASCLFDAVAGVGGMNHFLLAEPHAGHAAGEIDVHYGVYLMEILINEMISQGASKSRIRAHLYGGANLHAGMMAIGTANADFARSFLMHEHIQLARADLGGNLARRVDFRPARGQVRCRLVAPGLAPQPVPISRPPRANGDVELF